MQVITKLSAFIPEKNSPLILGLGNFDGLHLGHQSLLKHVIDEAKRLKGKAAAFTFYHHPQKILHPEKQHALLSLPEQKVFLLQKLGLDFCFLISFTKEFAALTPESFVKNVLVERLKIQEICMGYNARFGKDRQGDSETMAKLAKQWALGFYQEQPFKVKGEVVSSSAIRQFIQSGNLKKAEKFLGRPVSYFFHVVKGEGRGKQLGFPTANLDACGQILPPPGVYPVQVRIMHEDKRRESSDGVEDWDITPESAWMNGVLNYGSRPTFKGEVSLIPEVHILNYQGNIYGKTLEVEFHPSLRQEQTFQSAGALKKQIKIDIDQAIQYFKELKGN